MDVFDYSLISNMLLRHCIKYCCLFMALFLISLGITFPIVLEEKVFYVILIDICLLILAFINYIRCTEESKQWMKSIAIYVTPTVHVTLLVCNVFAFSISPSPQSVYLSRALIYAWCTFVFIANSGLIGHICYKSTKVEKWRSCLANVAVAAIVFYYAMIGYQGYQCMPGVCTIEQRHLFIAHIIHSVFVTLGGCHLCYLVYARHNLSKIHKMILFILIAAIVVSTINTVGYSINIDSKHLIYPWFVVGFIHLFPLFCNIAYCVLAPVFIYKLFPRRRNNGEEQSAFVNVFYESASLGRFTVIENGVTPAPKGASAPVEPIL